MKRWLPIFVWSSFVMFRAPVWLDTTGVSSGRDDLRSHNTLDGAADFAGQPVNVIDGSVLVMGTGPSTSIPFCFACFGCFGFDTPTAAALTATHLTRCDGNPAQRRIS